MLFDNLISDGSAQVIVNYIVPDMEIDMNSYPNILTPPSSSEDSQQQFFVLSESKSKFEPAFAQQHSNRKDNRNEPYLKITEPPVDRFRFRYKSEMTGTHGSLTGWSSDKARKQTFPTVELRNFKGTALIRCSIYQYNAKGDNMPHAHRLVKKRGRDEIDDPHDIIVSEAENYRAVFHNMGIIHTAKKNLIPELIRKKTQLKKEEIARMEGQIRPLTVTEEVDIKTSAENESRSINLNTVCLRFDAFVVQDDIKFILCKPVYTHGINNLKSALTGDLKIVRMDHCSSPAKGNREIFILVERVTKKNIKIRFYELDNDDNVIWQDYGRFSDLDVHHQYAIVFRTPAYKDLNITHEVKVFIELERPSDNARSDPREFRYFPSTKNLLPAKRPRHCMEGSASFDSSNIPSDELPSTINDLTLDTSLTIPNDTVNSEDLNEALNNIDSAEFNRIFSSFKEVYECSLTIDAPLKKILERSLLTGCLSNIQMRPLKSESNTTNIAILEDRLLKTTYEQLKQFIKTNPAEEKIIKMLNHYFNNLNKTNALHIAIKNGNEEIIMFILKLICLVKQFDLVNIKDGDFQTPLHLAIYQNNEAIIDSLLFCKAKISEVDMNMNTALHIAIIHNVKDNILQKLLSIEGVKDCIDYENNDGNTILNLAIEQKNQEALKLICSKGADVNKRHNKNGFTPLRFVIEKQELEMVQYLLLHSEIDPTIYDFKGINPIQAALKKENAGDIVAAIHDYIRQNSCANIMDDAKYDAEEMSDDDSFEPQEILTDIKEEPLSNEELEKMYSKVENFTPECLNSIAQLLDESGSWERLAESLELGHLMRSNLWESSCSPTKLVLKLAIESNEDTLLHIRTILQGMNENQAVQIIDNMVKQLQK